jgi:hypothetical protein
VRPYSIPLWSKPTRSKMQLTPFWNMSLRLRTALHCTALHCTALHCTALHCTQWSSRLFRNSRSLQLVTGSAHRQANASGSAPTRATAQCGWPRGLARYSVGDWRYVWPLWPAQQSSGTASLTKASVYTARALSSCAVYHSLADGRLGAAGAHGGRARVAHGRTGADGCADGGVAARKCCATCCAYMLFGVCCMLHAAPYAALFHCAGAPGEGSD